MNGDLASIRQLLDEMLAQMAGLTLRNCQVLVFPSYVYLPEVVAKLQLSDVRVGAQDVEQRQSGAVTGAVSATMLSDIGCTHVIVGHSERRTLFGESDEVIAEKCLTSINAGLTPIVCVGETLEERRKEQTLQVVSRQLQAVMDLIDRDQMQQIVLAYEPVWAIGTGESATPEQAEEVHLGLRALLSDEAPVLAEQVQILYGGSVTPENAESLFAMENVDGALVGGASLKGESFTAICEAAEKNYGNI